MEVSLVVVLFVIGALFFASAAMFRQAMRELRQVGQSSMAQVAALTSEIAKARAAFAPSHSVPCKSCSGTGRKVQENPLVAAVAKAIENGL